MPRESRDTFLFEDESDICADQALIAAFAGVTRAYTHRLRTSGYGSRHCPSDEGLRACQTSRAIKVPFH